VKDIHSHNTSWWLSDSRCCTKLHNLAADVAAQLFHYLAATSLKQLHKKMGVFRSGNPVLGLCTVLPVIMVPAVLGLPLALELMQRV
jgi:hypothetical protein